MSVLLRYESIVLWQVIAACALVTATAAQQPELPRLPAPPPMHLVSKSERSQLDEAHDPKSRLHQTLSLAEDHLTRAEKLTEEKKFDEASVELGDYLGLIGDLRDYFATLNHDKNSTRDLYRHFEFRIPGAHTHSATGRGPALHARFVRAQHQRCRGIYQGYAS